MGAIITSIKAAKCKGRSETSKGYDWLLQPNRNLSEMSKFSQMDQYIICSHQRSRNVANQRCAHRWSIYKILHI